MERNNELIIRDNMQLFDALKFLESSVGKTLFVVDNENRFIGTITDGDIRRWLLKDGKLLVEVKEVVCRDAFIVSQRYDVEMVKSKMRDLHVDCVPVVDKDHHITEVLYYESLFSQKVKKISIINIQAEVIIMAGGKGTRLDPFTRVLPKPLVPIGQKTIIETIIDKFLPYGVKHFHISIHYKSKIIKAYFEELQPEYSISYLEEEKPLGTAGSLYKLRGKVNKNILVTNCDILIDTNYNDLLDHHEQSKNDITVVATKRKFTIPYGVCEVQDDGELDAIREKPIMNFLVNAGVYILKPAVLDFVPQDEFFHITDLIDIVKKTSGKVGIYSVDEKSWVDTGEWDEYKKAVKKYSS